MYLLNYGYYSRTIDLMPIMEPEQNPSALRPEYEVYAESIENYFRSLRTQDYTGAKDASDAIRQYPSFFPNDPNRLHELTIRLARAYLRDDTPENAKKTQEEREQAFAIVLRSYTYSVPDIDTSLVYMTAAYVGADKKWLRQSLRPTPRLRFELGVRTKDSRFVRHKGHEIMRQLDLVPFYGSRLMHIIDSSI